MVRKCPEQQAELEQLAHLSRLALGSHRVWSVCGRSVWHLLQTGLCLFGGITAPADCFLGGVCVCGILFAASGLLL